LYANELTIGKYSLNYHRYDDFVQRLIDNSLVFNNEEHWDPECGFIKVKRQMGEYQFFVLLRKCKCGHHSDKTNIISQESNIMNGKHDGVDLHDSESCIYGAHKSSYRGWLWKYTLVLHCYCSKSKKSYKR
ncbi:hypothetical protein KUTeg_014243, partial [Tegillarca granosa]